MLLEGVDVGKGSVEAGRGHEPRAMGGVVVHGRLRRRASGERRRERVVRDLHYVSAVLREGAGGRLGRGHGRQAAVGAGPKGGRRWIAAVAMRLDKSLRARPEMRGGGGGRVGGRGGRSGGIVEGWGAVRCVRCVRGDSDSEFAFTHASRLHYQAANDSEPQCFSHHHHPDAPHLLAGTVFSLSPVCMSPSLSQAASNTKSIHLLRACLREATYLPDAVARQYFRQYILRCFKAYQPQQNATASFDVLAVEKHYRRAVRRRHVNIIADRTRIQQKKAVKGLRYLQRANQGEFSCMRKVLFYAYGRVGRRKHTLTNDLLKPSPILDGDALVTPPDYQGPTVLQELYYSNKRFLTYFDAPEPAPDQKYLISISDRFSRLRAVLRSQYQKGLSINRELKSHAFKTPMHNVWMRPMPIKRARNNIRRWYAETMTRLLPPIPTDEWNNIHAILNREKHVSLTRRRTPAKTRVFGNEPNQTQGQPELALIESLKLDKLSKAEKADRAAGMSRPANITPTFMRRLYFNLLHLCCKAEYDMERHQWIVVWGDSTRRISPKMYNAPCHESLFDGVNTAGKKLKAL